MIRSLAKYYNTHSMRLATAIFAIFAATTIQIKYWVYYSHDCLKINPYQISSLHNPQTNVHSKTTPARDHKAAPPCHSASEDNTQKHNHNSCSICQSFQQLMTAIFEPANEWHKTATKPHIISQLTFRQIVNKKCICKEASPRAPPIVNSLQVSPLTIHYLES